MRVLGPGSREIVSSGDPVADASARERVIEAYEANHQVVMEAADKAVLVIGVEDWPFPIPLVRANGQWRFDTAAGREGFSFAASAATSCARSRRASPMSTRREYAEKGIAGNASTPSASSARPARRMASIGRRSPASRAVLWQVAAAAASEGYRAGPQRIPYHGYYYKVLTGRGRTRAAARSTTSSAAR